MSDPLPEVYEIPEDRLGDPREEEAWFRRLPDGARDEMRRRWRAEEDILVRLARRKWERIARYTAEGALVFCVWSLLYYGFSLPTLLATCVGSVVGAVAGILRATNLLYGALGCVGVFLVSSNVFFWVGVSGTCAVVGAMHRINRADGTEPH